MLAIFSGGVLASRLQETMTPCSVPTRNLVGWGWEQEGAVVSRVETPRCGGQWGILLQPEPWDPPPLEGLGTEIPAAPCVFGPHQPPVLLRASGFRLCPQG